MLKNVKIKTKIVLIYVVLLLTLFFLTFTLFWVVNKTYAKQALGDAGLQTVSALSNNLKFIFENVTQMSNIVYFDTEIQKSLRHSTTKEISPATQSALRKSLINMVLSGNYVSGAYIFDRFNNVYNSHKLPTLSIRPEIMENTGWYRELKNADGNGFFIHNSEDVLKFYGENNYISYVREIRDQNTYEPMATLLLTIDGETINSYFSDVSKNYDSQFFIVSESEGYIIAPKQYPFNLLSYMNEFGLPNAGYVTASIDNLQMIIASLDLGIQDWKLVGAFPINSAKALAPYYSTVVIIIMIMNVIFVIVCTMALTRLIFKPLSTVEYFMKEAEIGCFSKMPVGDEKNEITHLKRVFNQMTDSLENLIETVKNEEQEIAKGKLDLITSQINPHFLYNTLDAVSALALTHDYENCFKMAQALGSFYRNSLNSGLDFVSIADELDCIKSYITILNIRHENKISLTVNADETLLACPVLKLILQPPVENAVKHGINNRPKGGKIDIQVFRNDNEIIFSITDDGLGMSEETIAGVLAGQSVKNKSGFGIYSLKQRISLYYGISEPVFINSEIGSGTEVIICIRQEEGYRDN